ncbi:UNVERIFIED_CONTAM: hypothetical protein K2H54_016040 [Gekko kuhli]
MPSYPSSASGSSSSSSSTSHLASPPSLAEMHHLQEKVLASPTQDSPGFLHGSKESAGSSSKNSSCDIEDFVMVPAQFSSDIAVEAAGGKTIQDSLMCSGSSLVTSAGLESQGRTPSPSPPYSSSPSPSGRPGQFSSGSKCGQSVPIPVPTQIHNYRRIEQNLQSPNQYPSPRRFFLLHGKCSLAPEETTRTGDCTYGTRLFILGIQLGLLYGNRGHVENFSEDRVGCDNFDAIFSSTCASSRLTQ